MVETGLKRGLNSDPGRVVLSIFHCGRMPEVKRTKMTNVSLEKKIPNIIFLEKLLKTMFFAKKNEKTQIFKSKNDSHF